MNNNSKATIAVLLLTMLFINACVILITMGHNFCSIVVNSILSGVLFLWAFVEQYGGD